MACRKTAQSLMKKVNKADSSWTRSPQSARLAKPARVEAVDSPTSFHDNVDFQNPGPHPAKGSRRKRHVDRAPWPRPPAQDFSRERNSVVECSLGSPTISTRPPYASTSSRSGTFSRV